jgi:signal transduction histidine kinase/CheY-like chemotaxis protein
LELVQETQEDVYGVILLHPGVPLSTQPDLAPRDVSSVVIRIPDLLRAATVGAQENIQIYLYDSTDISTAHDGYGHVGDSQHDHDGPVFLGAATVLVDKSSGRAVLHNLPALALHKHEAHDQMRIMHIDIATRRWTVALMCNPGTYQANIVLAILGGGIIFAACLCLALWVVTNMRRQAKMDQIKQAAATEKAGLIVDHALQAAKADRELNDFIAHEVRNPLAAAMSACNFVSSAVNEQAAPTAAARTSVREDVTVIENSLHFINDLLRNMLDMQRASSHQLKVENAPTDVLRDVLQPIDSMLYRRDGKYEVHIECPGNLVVSTDALRLKQIVLNLGRNSGKFVEHGFIRLRAAVVDGNVRVYIEDSGPGIPMEKRKILFTKFQESLDSLAQGTGIGLSLCMKLSELMGAHVWFDDTYESGVVGCPGSRFVIDLQTPPMRFDDRALDTYTSQHESTYSVSTGTGSLRDSTDTMSMPMDPAYTLPEGLSVLFVDDDSILRKLFCRSVKKVAPTWKFKEASNGETALRVVELETFDLIFMDQYMASVEKQLLGTETTRALRSKGVDSLICGLSANDAEQAFYSAGADAFMFKPFPCGKEALTRELRRALDAKRDRDS